MQIMKKCLGRKQTMTADDRWEFFCFQLHVSFFYILFQAGMDFLERSGIGKAPKVLLNGYVLDDAGVGYPSDIIIWHFWNGMLRESRFLPPKIWDFSCGYRCDVFSSLQNVYF